MINLLQATAPAPQAGGGYSLFIMLGLMILVLYFFMWRPESKRRKQMAQFRAGLKKGDKIITAGGIYGVVKEIKETTLLIEVDGNVTLRIDKTWSSPTRATCSSNSRNKKVLRQENSLSRSREGEFYIRLSDRRPK